MFGFVFQSRPESEGDSAAATVVSVEELDEQEDKVKEIPNTAVATKVSTDLHDFMSAIYYSSVGVSRIGLPVWVC